MPVLDIRINLKRLLSYHSSGGVKKLSSQLVNYYFCLDNLVVGGGERDTICLQERSSYLTPHTRSLMECKWENIAA